jgi:predicted enzyme related to lactoylglutathione lyase
MSERDTYPPGVPCWVEALQADPEAGAGFYGRLFGWDLVGSSESADEPPEYLVARLRGGDVAGIGALPESMPPAWVTHVRVESADATAERAGAAGGTVLDGPFDAPPAGRLAVLATRRARCSAPGKPASERARSASTSRERGR